ncbi:MAG: hypothetical protein IKO81_03850, partial [Bacteroidales bacterium]|nr:hypothetical protein [Bacteroidales bacterium]
CTQHSLKYIHSADNSIQIIRDSDNVEILTFHIPAISSGGNVNRIGSGSSTTIFLFSSPELRQGSYTLKYGGSISGGTNFHNYYTRATYSGGNSKTISVKPTFSVVTVN